MKQALLIMPLWTVGKLLEWNLEQVGYQVVSYRRFDDALQEIRSQRDKEVPDVIVVDCFPTNEAAREVLEAICEEPSFAASLLVSLVESQHASGELSHCRYREIEKPFKVEQVIEVIASHKHQSNQKP